MCRVAMYELLKNDSELQAFGIDQNHLWPNFALDGAPRDGIPWIVMRWGSRPSRFGRQPGGPLALTIWAYQIRQKGSDFTVLDALLTRCTELLGGVEHYEGTDGSVITSVDFRGYSEDLTDDGYDAIAKNAAYTVVCR